MVQPQMLKLSKHIQQEELSLEVAQHRVAQNGDEWLAKEIYNEEEDRRRSQRCNASKKRQANNNQEQWYSLI